VAQIVRRGSVLSSLESRQVLDRAIVTGRGGAFLSLTEGQCFTLSIR
jgi:hypothetical protein